MFVKLLFIYSLVVVFSHPAYLYEIPNGQTSPFQDNALTGHLSPDGGSRNPFGEAFGSASKVYSPDLCTQDSDGDGQTNGFELGDECCLWSKNSGDSVLVSTDLSFPGDASSKSSRPACSCENGASVKCSCCPYSSPSSSPSATPTFNASSPSATPTFNASSPSATTTPPGHNDDDDDDDDNNNRLYFIIAGGVGGALLLTAGVVAYHYYSRLAKASTPSLSEAPYGELPELAVN